MMISLVLLLFSSISLGTSTVKITRIEKIDPKSIFGAWFEAIADTNFTQERCVVHGISLPFENYPDHYYYYTKRMYRAGSGAAQTMSDNAFLDNDYRQVIFVNMAANRFYSAQGQMYEIGAGNGSTHRFMLVRFSYQMRAILVQDPEDFKQNYEKDVMHWLKTRGFDNQFSPADYSACHYSAFYANKLPIDLLDGKGSGEGDELISKEAHSPGALQGEKDVDLTKLTGTWFEGIISSRASKQRCAIHSFGKLRKSANGQQFFNVTKLHREGSESGKSHLASNDVMVASDEETTLRFGNDSFVIYLVGPLREDTEAQYEYVVMADRYMYPVTVLVRDPTVFKNLYATGVRRWLKIEGFITSFTEGILPINYAACYYSDYKEHELPRDMLRGWEWENIVI